MRRIKFAEYELDMDLFTLRHNGKKLEIGKRTLDLLICLIQNRDRVVDTEFLRSEVWHASALSPAAIPTCVRELRLFLGDNASNPAYIESKRGRGYRFIGEITRSPRRKRGFDNLLEELPFSGRNVELASLRSVMNTTIAQATGRLILVRGEAGMGKSRLLTEFLRNLPASTDRYVTRCSNMEGTPAFWPWTQILREALATAGGKNRELEENSQSLSFAFPEIRGSIESSITRASASDRFSILSQWLKTVRSISKSGPIVLVFDDIHRADFDSLSLLSWMAEELAFDPVIILASHRPSPNSDRVANALSELAGIDKCTTIDLTPLSSIDIVMMLDPLDVDRDQLSKELQLRTAGNPFYVTHLIRYLDTQSASESATLAISKLPPNSREIVSRQLCDLAPATREALAVASVEGGTFSISTTAATLGVSAAELIVLLEPAQRAWLICEDGTEFAFRHALLREALYQTIDSSRRRDIHLTLACILIERGDSYSNSARISDHLEKASPTADSSEIQRFALLAGRQAAARFAYSDAQVFFRRALNSIVNDPTRSIVRECQIRLEYADAQLHAGQRDGSRETLLETVRLSRASSLYSILASCALDLTPEYLSIEVGEYDPTGSATFFL
jgi:predicted ATPase